MEPTLTSERRPVWPVLLRLVFSILLIAVLMYAIRKGWLTQSLVRTVAVALLVLAAADVLIIVHGLIRDPLARVGARLVKWLHLGGRDTNQQPARGDTGAIESSPPPSVDHPTDLLGDQLDFKMDAYVLAQYIATCPTPMTLGIHGAWGTGKSSLSRMIQDLLLVPTEVGWSENDPRLSAIMKTLAVLGRNPANVDELPQECLQQIEIIQLNAWRYESAEALWRALILQILRTIEALDPDEKVEGWRHQLYYQVTEARKGDIRLDRMVVFTASVRVILAAAGFFALPSIWFLALLGALGLSDRKEGLLPSFEKMFEQEKYTLTRNQLESTEQFEEALKDLIGRLVRKKGECGAEGAERRGGRIVIFIDDLDRCLPSVALDIMETIKTFLDVPGCIFVLLCDQRLVGEGVRLKFQGAIDADDQDSQNRGREYIDKIIQVPFHIPPSDEGKMRNLAKVTQHGSADGRDIPYFDVVYSAVGDNPRMVKRLCRGLEMAWDMMQLRESASTTRLTALATPRDSSPPDDLRNGSGGVPEEPDAVSDVSPLTAEAAVQRNAQQERLNRQKREFAKVYCLRYRWPDAFNRFRTQEAAASDQIPVPSGIRAIGKKELTDRTPTDRNLLETADEVDTLLTTIDARYVVSYVLDVDWKKAETDGKAAIQRRNLELWRYLQTPPFLHRIPPEDMKRYVSWSSAVAGEDQMYAEVETDVDKKQQWVRLAMTGSKELQGADLSGVDLSNLDLSDANLSRANLGAAILGSTNLARANLRYANLRNASLLGVDLTGADLQGAWVQSFQLINSKLEQATMPDGRPFTTWEDWKNPERDPDVYQAILWATRCLRRLRAIRDTEDLKTRHDEKWYLGEDLESYRSSMLSILDPTIAAPHAQVADLIGSTIVTRSDFPSSSELDLAIDQLTTVIERAEPGVATSTL